MAFQQSADAPQGDKLDSIPTSGAGRNRNTEVFRMRIYHYSRLAIQDRGKHMKKITSKETGASFRSASRLIVQLCLSLFYVRHCSDPLLLFAHPLSPVLSFVVAYSVFVLWE